MGGLVSGPSVPPIIYTPPPQQQVAPPAESSPSAAEQEAENPAATKERELQSMMRDPKYWRDRDPSYVSKVTDGFKAMYGDR